MSDDPKCANEPALILAGMISTSAPFARLHPCAAVPIAAQIVDAIREGKVPGIVEAKVLSGKDTPCNEGQEGKAEGGAMRITEDMVRAAQGAAGFGISDAEMRAALAAAIGRGGEPVTLTSPATVTGAALDGVCYPGCKASIGPLPDGARGEP